MNTRRWMTAVTLTLTFAAAVRGGVAHAQSPAAEPPGGGQLEEVVVTGTRVGTHAEDTPTPVTVVTTNQLSTLSPNSIPDALNRLPQFSNSVSPTSTPAQSSGTPLGNYLNLRNLGINRTLILLDGQRVPPTDNTGGVDVNSLPELLVQRIDVVTGGASAVYGSDAVTGVVNYVLDQKFEGIKGLLQGGISRYGDDSSYRVGLAGGTSLFSERLHLIGSVEHYKSAGVLLKSSRPLGQNADGSYATYGTDGSGTAADPFTTVRNPVYSFATAGGLIASGPLAYQYMFQPDGSLAPYIFGKLIGGGCCSIGGSGASIPADTPPLVIPYSTNLLFGRASYDITSSLSAFAQLKYSNSGTRYTAWPAFNFCPSYQCPTLFTSNPFLSAADQALFGASTNFTLSRLSNDDLPRDYTEQNENALLASAGLDGNYSGWHWKLNLSHGESHTGTFAHETDSARFFAAVDAVQAPDGTIACRVTLTNPGLYPGCAPLNLFGVGAPSAQAAAWVRGVSVWSIKNQMDLASLSVTASPVELPAGPLTIAFGGEYRNQKLTQASNSDPAIPFDYTGLLAAPPGAQHFLIDNVGVGNGSVNVKEGFAEVEIPVLSKLPFAHSLELNGAFRYTQYSTSGGVKTYKGGLVWAPVEDFKIRATRSRDIRAPSLFELYAGTQVGTTSFTDPHTGTSGAMVIVTGGNPNLVPEIGTTTTIGFVYQPRWLEGLVVSLDAYSIEIANAIAVTNADQEVADCDATNGTGPVCNLIQRPLPYSDQTPANRPTSITVTNLNTANLKQRGIDLDGTYKMGEPVLGGRVSLRALATWVPRFDTQQSATAALVPQAGFDPNPKWRGVMSVNYQRDKFSVTLSERGTSSFAPSPQYVWASGYHYPSAFYTDLTAAFNASDNSELFLTVNNLLDRDPPLTPSVTQGGLVGAQPVTNPGTLLQTDQRIYDVLGLYVTAGVRIRF